MRHCIVRHGGRLLLLVTLTACGGSPGADKSRDSSAAARRTESKPAPVTPVSRPSRRTILFVGTSLTAGFGLEPDSAFPALIQQKIDSAGLAVTVVNAGVSGETTVGLLERLWSLRETVSAYDASYVAVAEALDVPLLTADARLARAPGPTCPITVVRS